jgi:hypothetical protein
MTDPDSEAVGILALRRDLANGVPIGLAVQAPQDRERQDHGAVLVGAVGAPQLIGDRPDETTEAARRSPSRLARLNYAECSTTDCRTRVGER